MKNLWEVDVTWVGYSYATVEVKASSEKEAVAIVTKMRDANELSTFDLAWEESCDETSRIEVGDASLPEGRTS